MRFRPHARSLLVTAALLFAPLLVGAQGTAADYARAAGVAGRFQGMTFDVMDQATWVGSSNRLVYRKSVKGGHQFVLADAAAGTKAPAFDHARLANAIKTVAPGQHTAITLPIAGLTFDTDQQISFTPASGGGGGARGGGGGRAGRGGPPAGGGERIRCSLADYTCVKIAAPPPAPDGAPGGRGGRGGRGGGRGRGDLAPAQYQLPVEPELDGDGNPIPDEGPWDNGWNNSADVTAVLQQQQQGQGGAPTGDVRVSPDGRSEALILNYNVYIRPVGAASGALPLTVDGSEGDFYTLQSVVWSPDSKKLVAYRVVPGYRRMVHYVFSSPPDQFQPKDTAVFYAKPGDRLDVRRPVLVDVATRKAIVVDNALFPNAYTTQAAQWWRDSRAFTFEYNQRGHQAYRVIEVDATTGRPRALIDETVKTFINYRRADGGLTSGGATWRQDIADGKEIIWMSERDNWTHLYLYDGTTGQVKNQITKGQWVVRGVNRVDTVARQIYFTAGGMNAGQDPYFTHFYRINFDGTGLVKYTDADGNHSITWSPDGQYYTDSWSRVDLPPQSQVRRTSDQKVVVELEKGQAPDLVKAGIVREVFVAKGRDGTTDIWGTIQRPATFDPTKKYAVIEAIYAGPHGSHVQKGWADVAGDLSMAEAGYIVVHIDGMGTKNRSKAFHDVAWRNVGDAGFPDRILWHKAVAAKYPWYDATRVGIYGTSAGGQNALGALLFHPEFYKAAYANSGCHDNRMDKIWWNEQWMGYPIDEAYDKSSNLINAHKLKGSLILVVPEFDTNVDPSSTYQVANALMRANKHFELIFVANGGHGAGGQFATNKRNDMFNKVFYNVDPPNRNGTDAPPLAPFGR